MFERGSDYKSELNAKINELFDRLGTVGFIEFDVDKRIKDVQSLTDLYVENTGERPSSEALDRMATLIIKEDKKGRKGVKVKDEGEYPILSDRQYEGRMRRESAFIDAEATYDSNGVNRKVQTRSSRITDELRTKKVK